MASLFREQMDRVIAVLKIIGDQSAALTVLPEHSTKSSEAILDHVLSRCSEKLQRALLAQLTAEGRMVSSPGSVLELMAARESAKLVIRAVDPPEISVLRSAGSVSGPVKHFVDLLEDTARLFRVRVETAPSRAATDERSHNISVRVAAAEKEIEKLKERLKVARESRTTSLAAMERQHAQLKAELEEIQRSRTVNEAALTTYASEQDVGLRSSHELKVRVGTPRGASRSLGLAQVALPPRSSSASSSRSGGAWRRTSPSSSRTTRRRTWRCGSAATTLAPSSPGALHSMTRRCSRLRRRLRQVGALPRRHAVTADVT